MGRFKVKLGWGRPPVWTGAPAAITTTAGATFNWSPYASDPDGSTLSFSLVNPASGYSITSGGLMTVGAAGASVTVRVSDGSFTADHTATVAVGPVALEWVGAGPYALAGITAGSGDEVELSTYYVKPENVTESLTIVSDTSGLCSISGTKLVRPATLAVGSYDVVVDLQASVTFEPAITGEPQAEQYVTWDAGSGPSFAWWSARLGIKWVHPTTGDFTDANGTAQGTTPFVSVSTPGANQYYSFNVATLVTRALTANKGWYLKASGSGAAVKFRGRTAANPPLLTVVTNTGTFNCPIQSNAQWYPQATSSVPVDSRASVTLQSDWLSIVRFDLSGVTGTVQSATMQLYVYERYGTGTAIQVYEANPPTFQMGAGSMTPTVGLAAEVGENNLSTHPDVYMAGDFAGTTFDLANGDATVPKLFGSVECLTGVGTASIVADDQAPGTYYWRGSFVPVYTGQAPQRQAFNGTKRLMNPNLANPLYPTANVVEEAYYRQYVMLEDDFNTSADGNKFGITWDLRGGYWVTSGGGYWQATTGNGGLKGSGKRLQYVIGGSERYVYEGHMERTECGLELADGNPYAALRPLVGYNYHIDQGGPFPGGWPTTDDEKGAPNYGNLVAAKFKKGRWYCIEQRLKMNTIDMSSPDAQGNGVANYDGILETWLDGILIDRWTNYRWRHHPEMGIFQVNANWYMGGVQTMTSTMHFRLNHFVVAKRYIGPRVKP